MVNGVVRKRFRKPARRFNVNVGRTLPPRIPNGQKGRMMRISEAERRLIARRRQQSKGIRRTTIKGIRPI
ncbi:MAG: hypothetical protein GTO02_10580 [Candidatus Dadabacteria bacterium]|nr:hypothetical protein [Candidatus Dadabacteria bacterium]